MSGAWNRIRDETAGPMENKEKVLPQYGEGLFLQKKRTGSESGSFFLFGLFRLDRGLKITLFISACRPGGEKLQMQFFFLRLNCIIVSFYHMYGESQDVFTIFYKKKYGPCPKQAPVFFLFCAGSSNDWTGF